METSTCKHDGGFDHLKWGEHGTIGLAQFEGYDDIASNLGIYDDIMEYDMDYRPYLKSKRLVCLKIW